MSKVATPLMACKDPSATPPKVMKQGGKLALQMSPDQGRQIGGTNDPDFIETLANQVALATPGQGKEAKPVNAALAGLTGIQPRDELEAMLGAQMTAVHSMSMEMAKRALLPEQTVEGVSDSSSPMKFRQKMPNAMKKNGIQEMSEALCLATEGAV